MSGLEVVGLVLGIFPLVISAFEHYKDVHKAANLIVGFETAYRRSLDDVKDEQLFFHLSLEELLLPMTRLDDFEDDEALETILSDLTSQIWRTGDVPSVFQERLGPAYSRFVEIACALHGLLSRLLATLITDKPLLRARLEAKTVRISVPQLRRRADS